jgi:hypothetical protein
MSVLGGACQGNHVTVSTSIGGLYDLRTSGLTRSPESDYRKKHTPWPESASELYRPSDRCFSAKSLPTLLVEECRVVGAANF